MYATQLDYQLYLRKYALRLLSAKIDTNKPLLHSLSFKQRDRLKKLYVDKYTINGFQDLLTQAKEANKDVVIWDSLDNLIEEQINLDLLRTCSAHMMSPPAPALHLKTKVLPWLTNVGGAVFLTVILVTGFFGFYQTNGSTSYEFVTELKK